jgi:uncharacterized protein involved in response to NO
MEATGVFVFISTVCALAALIVGALIRFSMFLLSNEHTLKWHDEASKLCGVVAGILFAFFFVAFIFGIRRDNNKETDSQEKRRKEVV